MLNPLSFGNAFAASTVAFYLILYLLRILARPFFNLLINSQFFGADFASQTPIINPANMLGMLIAVAIVAWIFGWLTAYFYNYFQKKSK